MFPSVQSQLRIGIRVLLATVDLLEEMVGMAESPQAVVSG